MTTFDASHVDLNTASQRDIVCYLASLDEDDAGGSLGLRISSVFVIFIASTATTMFPVLSTHVKRIRIPLYLYLFFRFFGSGVIIATAYIHLLDPAYEEIGPASCVGLTGNWSVFTWPPAIAMAAALVIFLFDFLAGWYVTLRDKRGTLPDLECDCPCVEDGECKPVVVPRASVAGVGSNLHFVAGEGGADTPAGEPRMQIQARDSRDTDDKDAKSSLQDGRDAASRSFQEQIAAFLILEFGIIFHSVIIGLNLGVVGAEFTTLYPVMVFHQSFEGLGIGARLSAITFPPRLAYLPWVLALAYGLTTPVSIAAGMGVRTSYDSGSFASNVVSGVVDSASAGILMYTGLVEMLARDFLFDPHIITDKKRVAFMLLCLFAGTALMSMLGKWA